MHKMSKKDEEFYTNLETLLLAHRIYVRKLKKTSMCGEYDDYMKRVTTAKRCAPIVEETLIKHVPTVERPTQKEIRRTSLEAASSALLIGGGVLLQIALPSHPLPALIAGGVMEFVGLGVVWRFSHRLKKEEKLSLANVNVATMWNALKLIPDYSEGFMRVNNIENLNIFDEYDIGTFIYHGDGKVLHDPIKEDDKTKESFKKFLKESHLDDECKIL